MPRSPGIHTAKVLTRLLQAMEGSPMPSFLAFRRKHTLAQTKSSENRRDGISPRTKRTSCSEYNSWVTQGKPFDLTLFQFFSLKNEGTGISGFKIVIKFQNGVSRTAGQTSQLPPFIPPRMRIITWQQSCYFLVMRVKASTLRFVDLDP